MTWWLWVVIGFGLLVLELALPSGFFIVFFGLSALLIGIFVFLIPTLSISAQWIAFAVLTVILLLLFRKKLIARASRVPSPSVDSFIGQIATTTSEIVVGTEGSVTLHGTSWRALNIGDNTIALNSSCRVESIDGVVLKVRSV
jgi:inner membrane protein